MAVNIKNEFGTSRHKPDLTTLVYGKIPPQALELEAAIIGACLLERNAFNEALSVIYSIDCFYSDAHQKIWQSMLELLETGNVVDMLTVADQLRKNGNLEIVGGAYALASLTNKVTVTAHIINHAQIVVEKFMAREVIRICGMAVGEAYDDTNDVFDLLSILTLQLSDITSHIGGAGDISIGSAFLEVLQQIEKQKNTKSALTGLDTGIFELNELTNGFQNTDLIVIGGRPGKGKSALGLNLALSAASTVLVQNVPVGFLSLEMSRSQLVKRMASTVSGIDFKKVYSGNITESEFLTISNLTNYFGKLPIRIADQTRSWQKLQAQVRKWKEKYDIGLVIIDYLQLMRGARTGNTNREQEIATITGDCKALAKELDIPIIVLAQLNRDVEKQAINAQEPSTAHLRESGAIEADADIIIFPWHISPEESRISVAKNRNGQTATGEYAIKMKFIGSIQKWCSANEAEKYTDTIKWDNPRSGIVGNYQQPRMPYKDDDAPFN